MLDDTEKKALKDKVSENEKEKGTYTIENKEKKDKREKYREVNGFDDWFY